MSSSRGSDDYYCGWCNSHWWTPIEDDHCCYCVCVVKNCAKRCLRPLYRANLIKNSNGTYSLEKTIKYCQQHYEELKEQIDK